METEGVKKKKERAMESEALHKPSTSDSEEEWSRAREGIELEGSGGGREGEDTWGKSWRVTFRETKC